LNLVRKNALRGRFFMPVLSGMLSILPGPLYGGGTDPACRTDVYSSSIEIQHVIDGDTVKLADGTNLRLIGLDTPEIGRRGSTDEPGAKAAREYLARLVVNHPRLPVIFDAERHDRHGRLLGHLFLEDGTNIQARILAEGYGTPLIIPPNLKFLDCYLTQADAAVGAGRGIWSYHRYRILDTSGLDPEARGYHRISGPVTRMGESPSSIWVNMGNNLALRIVKSDLEYFTGIDLLALTGKTVLARGIVYRRNRQLRIRIRHPADLQILPN
jgi:micrococcal nuclease